MASARPADDIENKFVCRYARALSPRSAPVSSGSGIEGNVETGPGSGDENIMM